MTPNREEFIRKWARELNPKTETKEKIAMSNSLREMGLGSGMQSLHDQIGTIVKSNPVHAYNYLTTDSYEADEVANSETPEEVGYTPTTGEESVTDSVVVSGNAPKPQELRGSYLRAKISGNYADADTMTSGFKERAIEVANDLVMQLPEGKNGGFLIGGYEYSKPEAANIMLGVVENTAHPMLLKNAAYRDEWFWKNGDKKGWKHYLEGKYAEWEKSIADIERLIKKQVGERGPNVGDGVATRMGVPYMATTASYESEGRAKLREVKDLLLSIKKDNLWGGIDKGFDEVDMATMGLNSFFADVDMARILGKAMEGEELTSREKVYYDLWVLQQDMEQTRELKGSSVWSSIGEGIGITAEMLPSFYLGMNIAKAVPKMALKAVPISAVGRMTKTAAKKGVLDAMKTAIGGTLKAGGRMVTNVAKAEVAGLIASPFLPSTWGMIAEKRGDQYSKEEGRLVYKPKAMWKDVLSGWFEMSNEIASELVGARIAKMIGGSAYNLGRILGVDKLANKIGISTKASHLLGWKKPEALRVLQQNLGYTGPLAEPTSEVWGDVAANLMKSAYGEGDFRQFKDKDYWLTTLGVSAIYGGSVALATSPIAIKDYLNSSVHQTGKMRKVFLNKISDKVLRDKVLSITALNDIEMMSSELAHIDWSNFNNVDVAYAMDFIRADMSYKVQLGDAKESIRQQQYENVVLSASMLSYRGVQGDSATNTQVIVETADGAQYYVISGDINAEGEEMLDCVNLDGQKVPLHVSKVAKKSYVSLDDVLAEGYKQMFGVQIEQERQQDIIRDYFEMDLASAEDIARLMQSFGSTKRENGETVNLTDGKVGVVEQFNADSGTYLVTLADGMTVNVPFYDILEADELVAEAQSLNYSQRILNEVEKEIDAEEQGSEDIDEDAELDAWVASELESETSEGFKVGDIIATPNGSPARVLSITQEGKVVVDENKDNNSGSMANAYMAEYDASEITPYIEDVTPTNPVAAEVEKAVPIAEEATPVETTQEQEEDSKAMEEIQVVPRTEDGAVDYESITEPKMYAELYSQEVGDMETAVADIVSMRDNARIEIEKKRVDAQKANNANDKIRLRKEAKSLEERIRFYDEVLTHLAPEGAMVESTSTSEVEETGTASAPDQTEQIGVVQNDWSKHLTEEEFRIVDVMAKKLGLQVAFVKELVEENGIKANARIIGNKVEVAWVNRKGTIPFLIGHEFTHRMRDLSPEMYGEVLASVENFLGPKEWSRRERAMRNRYRSVGMPISEASITEEVIADFVGEMVEKHSIFNGYVESNSNNPKLLQFITDIFKAIRDFFRQEKAVTEEKRLDDMLNTLDKFISSAIEKAQTTRVDETDKGRIRHSLSTPSLVGVHNISLDKLRKVSKMGGLANPSVAVIDVDKQTHDDYGEYSLVLPKNMVDARQGKNAGTWAGDAWTPTYPPIIKRMKDEKSYSRFHKDIVALPEAMRNKVRLEFDSFMEGRSADPLAYWYLFEKGDAPELVLVPSRYSDDITNAVSEATKGSFSMYGLTPDERAKCVDAYIAAKFNGDRAAFEQEMQERINRLTEALETKKSDRVKKWAQDTIDAIKEYGFDYDAVADFIRDVEYDAREKGTVNDSATTMVAREQIKANNLEADYEAWLNSLEERYGIEEYIFDGYTNSGNRRYLPHTLENVSKWMKKQGRQGAVATFPSFGVFIATAIPKMTSLESIRKRKALLGKSKEEYDAFREKWENVYFELGKRLQPDAKGFDDYGYWRLIEAVGKSNPKEFIKKEYGIELSEEDMAMFNDMVKAIRTEYPARYFETKFERPLQLSDFTAAVVPNDIPLDVESRLKDANVEIFEYEKGDNASRAEAMQKASQMENVRFSLQETNERFNAELAALTEENARERIFDLGRPSSILLSTGIEDKPIRLYGAKLLSKLRKHGYDKSALKNLPLAINLPIAVFEGSHEGSFAILTELKIKDNNILAALSVGKGGHDIDFNIISSVYDKRGDSVARWVTDGKMLYVDKKKALDYFSVSAPLAEAQNNQELISTANIIQNFENPKIEARNSLITPEMDASYLDAVERGDMATAQQMVMEAAKLAMPNTKVVDENGNPKVVYHQTNATVYINRETGQNWDELDWRERMEWDERDDWDDYWEEREFNTFSRVNARTTQELDGFFFAPEYDEYHEYGDRTIEAFLNIENPASREDYNIDSSKNNAGRDERIRLQNEGYDGVIREEDGTIWEYVAFDPNQIKSADPVTYDDAGNIIPLSERFNPRKEDIRYSLSEDTTQIFDAAKVKFDRQVAFTEKLVRENNIPNPVFIAQTAEEFVQMLRDYGFEEKYIDKGMQGCYITESDIIVLNGGLIKGTEGTNTTLRHEFAHSLTEKYLKDRIKDIVSSLDERKIDKAIIEMVGDAYEDESAETKIDEMISFLVGKPSIDKIKAIFEGEIPIDTYISVLKEDIGRIEEEEVKDVLNAVLPLVKENIELQKEQYGAEREITIVLPRRKFDGLLRENKERGSISQGDDKRYDEADTQEDRIYGSRPHSQRDAKKEVDTRYSIYDNDDSDIEIEDVGDEGIGSTTEDQILIYLKHKHYARVKEIRDRFKQLRDIARTDLKNRQAERRAYIESMRTNSARIDYILGDSEESALPLAHQALVRIARGEIRIKWADSADGKKKGLASELGYKDAERRLYSSITKDATLYFDEAVHEWWQMIDGYTKEIDTQDLRNALIEALGEVASPKGALSKLREIYDRDEVQYDDTMDAYEQELEKELAEEKARYEAEVADFEGNKSMYVREYEERTSFFNDITVVGGTIEEVRKTIDQMKAKANKRVVRVKSQFLEWREGIEAVKKAVKETITSSNLQSFQRNELRRILDKVDSARSLNEVDALLVEIDNILQDVAIRKQRMDMDRMLKVRLPDGESLEAWVQSRVQEGLMSVSEGRKVVEDLWKGRNASGVSVASRVDEETKNTLEKLRELISPTAYSQRVEDANAEERGKKVRVDKELSLGESAITANDKRIQELEDKRQMDPEKYTSDDESEYVARCIYAAYLDAVMCKQEVQIVLEGMAETEMTYYGMEDQKETKRILLEAQRDDLVEAKKTYLKALEGLNNDLLALLREGRDKLQLIRKEERAHKERTLRLGYNALRVDTRIIGQLTTVMQKIKAIVRGLVNAPFWTFQTVCKEIDHLAPNGEGNFYNHFMYGLQGCADNYYKQFSAHIDEVGRNLAKALGRKYNNAAHFIADVIEESDRKIVATITYGKGLNKDGQVIEPERYNLTISNAMYLLAMYRQPMYRATLNKRGIDDRVMDALQKALNKENKGLIVFMDWVNDIFLPDTRLLFDQVHKQMFGVSMAEEKNYFPARVVGFEEKQDISLNETGALPSTITKSVIQRIRNGRMPDVRQNYFKVLMGHLMDMNNWSAFAPMIRDLNILVSDNRFRNMCNTLQPGNNADGGGYGSLFQAFKTTAAIAVNCYRPRKAIGDELITTILKGWAGSKIAFRVNTALKQFASSPVFLVYMLDKECAKEYISSWWYTLAHGKELLNWMKEVSPSFKKRVDSKFAGMDVFERKTGEENGFGVYSEWKASKIGSAVNNLDNLVKRFAVDVGMAPNAAIDALVVMSGFKAVYEYEIKRMMKGTGLEQPTEEMKKKAIIKAEVAFNSTQQSAESLYLSQIQVDRSYLTNVLTVFLNSSFGYHRLRWGGYKELVRLNYDQNYRAVLKAEYGDKFEEVVKDARKKARSQIMQGVLGDLVFAMTGGFGTLSMFTMFGGGDDDGEVWESFKQSLFVGLVNTTMGGFAGGTILANAIQGYDISLDTQFEEMVRDLKWYGKLLKGEENLFAAIGHTLNLIAKYRYGMDFKTFENMTIGVQNLFDGSGGNEAIMKMLNAPESQIAIIAGRRREGETSTQYIDRIRKMETIWKAEDDARERELLKQFNEEYRKDMVYKYGGASEWRRQQRLEEEYEEVVKDLGWEPNARPNVKAWETGVFISPVEAVTQEQYQEMCGIGASIAGIEKYIEKFVGEETEYYNLIQQSMELKEQLKNKYNESKQ